ncbi:MAG: DUF362 domain-containing protein [Zhaonellaceae bacterium]|nr:4Fe-4S binding protein [Clostridia bacterium]
MVYKITDACLSCGICMDECPSGAISEGEEYFVINKDVCTECGSCADVCPNEAIVEE